LIIVRVEQVIPEWLLEQIDNSAVTDICISENQLLVDSGNGLEQVIAADLSEENIGQLARELIELGGRRLDQSHPFADVSLPGGIRLHAVLKSGCSASTLISIRLHSNDSLALEELISQPFANFDQQRLVNQIVHSGESFLISGATGSGKTTLLRAMLTKTNERVIAVEDVTELAAGNIISLQTRTKNIEGQGEITLDELIRESLRMRPDRLVVGEVRGSELISMLQALNTGHRGATTIHANSLEVIPERLLAIASSTGISDNSLARLVAAAFDWVIALEVRGNQRMIAGIGKFKISGGVLEIHPAHPSFRLALA
jgi:pilus assembly protein CpaF